MWGSILIRIDMYILTPVTPTTSIMRWSYFGYLINNFRVPSEKNLLQSIETIQIVINRKGCKVISYNETGKKFKKMEWCKVKNLHGSKQVKKILPLENDFISLV